MKAVTFLLLIITSCQTGISQELAEKKITRKDIDRGIIKRYQYVNRHDGSVEISLYKNNKFEYLLEYGGGVKFSYGTWRIQNNQLVLNSSFDVNNVPVKVEYNVGIDSMRWRNTTNIQVPVDIKGKRYGDAMIYINDTTSYCFPFFDTCVGNYDLIKRVKVDFGGGFKSNWIALPITKFAQLRIIVDTEFDLFSYLSFRNRKYKILKSSIVPM